MKYINFNLFFVPLLVSLLISCSSPDIKLSYDFDHGSLGEMIEEEPGHFIGSTLHWLKNDSVGDQYYWFYFQADHVEDKTVTFELSDLAGIYRGKQHIVYTDYTQPLYSYDQESWERIRNVKYDSASSTFQFSEFFTSEPVWIAYAHPYPTSRLTTVIDGMKSSEFVQMEDLAETGEGRSIKLVHITDFRIPGKDKKNVLILALQHAGEDAGAYMAEGMINFLLSDDLEARKAREAFNYFIVPMMNPDGIYHGTSRYNMHMEDLNNIWLSDEKAQAEVNGVKDWVETWYGDGNEIDLFIDIHNHSQFHRYNVMIFQNQDLDSLATVMDKHWPVRLWHTEFKGSSNAWFFSKGIPNALIELSQSHLADGKYLEIEDYLSFGKGAVEALNEYFKE